MFEGKDIKLKRKNLGLSAAQLADILQISKDNIYKWEKGTRPTNPEDYLKVEAWVVLMGQQHLYETRYWCRFKIYSYRRGQTRGQKKSLW